MWDVDVVSHKRYALDHVDSGLDDIVRSVDIAGDSRRDRVQGIVDKGRDLVRKVNKKESQRLAGHASATAAMRTESPPRTTNSRRHKKVDRYMSMTNSIRASVAVKLIIC